MFKTISVCMLLLGWHVTLLAQADKASLPEPEIAENGRPVPAMLDRYLSRAVMLALFTDHVERPGYSSQLELIRKLKPAYLSRIAGSWGLPETDLLPGGKLFNSTRKVIDDVRQMYREDSVAMPMIEAGIFEAITTDVDRIPIPEWVLLAFADDPEVKQIKRRRGKAAYFNAASMRNTGHPNWSEHTWVPDINRIHTRLWFYYLSTIFIDMGCHSIHFGWFELITEHDSTYVKTDKLFEKIRAYARQKNSFVVFNADIDRVLYVNNTEKILLDFLSSPIRPEPAVHGFPHSPCEGEPMAELNIPRYNKGLMQQRGGVTANGDTVKNIPVLFNLDWYGVEYRGKQPGQMGLGDGGWAPWKVNETIWFFSLSYDCQRFWLQHVAAAIKNNVMERAYVKMPAVQPLAWWGYPVNEYLMSRNKGLVSAIRNSMWKVEEAPFFTITRHPETSAVALNIANPDLTSIYSWRIAKKDTDYELLAHIGNHYTLHDLPAGTYTVTLRRDNAMFAGKEKVQVMEKELIIE